MNATTRLLGLLLPQIVLITKVDEAISLASTMMKKEQAAPHMGRFYEVTPKWEGSSYSYVRPSKKEDESSKMMQSLEFPHCGSIHIEHHPDRVARDGIHSTGFALWSAALAVAEYVDARCGTSINRTGAAAAALPSWNNTDTNTSLNSTTTTRRRTCLELGAGGAGLPSIVLARHGWNVVATDHDPEVLPLLKKNFESNLNSTHQKEQPGISVELLDWAKPNSRLVAELAPDLIVASDVIWNATRPVWGDLLDFLHRMRQNYRKQQQQQRQHSSSSLTRGDGSPTPHSDPLVLMGYTQRRKDMTLEEEREFFAMLQQHGMEAWRLPVDVAPYSDHWPLTVLFELRWTDNDEANSL